MSAKPINAASLKYGRDNEEVVFELFQREVQKEHVNGRLHKTGMKIATNRPWLSATADGIVTCECHGKFVVEIKCPYSARHMTCTEFWNDQSSYVYGGTLRNDHTYYTQVQLQMEVYDIGQCLFLVKLNDGFIACNIPKDQDFLDELLPKLEAFWKKHVVRELLTRAVESFKKPTHPATDEDIYCYCKRPWDGSEVMIGCDGLQCLHNGWIHLACVRPKRKTVPKNNWYCKDCKKQK